ncbi:DUF5750 family protein [Methanobrevibacter sp.]|uniref:DUF5750 family protein n=1 Tax=Methanobrevibacter sp. TaxID=66852 RepID=UPI0025DCF993|nr:DUF5750 family protein [Methanobrevibacter sp.]MBQ6512617.1 hypothetical protein [Methanobrevibacter sp.]
MIVKITDYGDEGNQKFVEYVVSGLSLNQMEFLNNNLKENITIEEGVLKLKMYFSDELYPFQSDVAKFRLNDFIAREEIEMNLFISSFLDDM